MFESQLMQIPAPRDIVIFSPPGHFLLCKSPEAGHTFRCKSPGVPWGGGGGGGENMHKFALLNLGEITVKPKRLSSAVINQLPRKSWE